MIRACPAIFGLAVLLAVFSINAQTPPDSNSNIRNIPLPPQPPSPVKFFRELLAMTPADRASALTNRTPEARLRIMAKVREYQRMDPNERELRLCATELRWYLTPLFRMTTDERGARLAQVPDNLRELVKARLTQWDALAPAVQKELLDNDRTLHYFAHVETTNSLAVSPEAQQLADQFNRFFDLTDAEKQQTLGTLSEDERAAMEKTLASFKELTPQQQALCKRNFVKFAGMSGTERTEFLKNAEKWSKMSPQERQSWRDLVANVPMWPPLPATMPPLPPAPAARVGHASMATN
jgi:hypothetical protein